MAAGAIVGLGLLGLLALTAAAAKAKAAAAAPSAPAKPKVPEKPKSATPDITGLPGEVTKIIKEAMASNDPTLIRDAAYKLADLYPVQAANLLHLADIVEGSTESTGTKS